MDMKVSLFTHNNRLVFPRPVLIHILLVSIIGPVGMHHDWNKIVRMAWEIS
jgi:hypothetical protein